MISEGSYPVAIVWKWVSCGAPHDARKVCCIDDSVEAAWKHLYNWVPYDTREVCCSDDREETAQKHQWICCCDGNCLSGGSHTCMSAQVVHWSDDSEDSPPPPSQGNERPRGTHNIPTCIMISPICIMISPTVIMISPRYWTHIIQGENRKVKSRLHDTNLSTRNEKHTYD